MLVVGSQCDAVDLELSVLPGAAHELADVLARPDLGGCTPALPTGPALIDPTAAELDDALTAAIRRAHEEQATLFLVFIGHGGVEDDDFYLLAKDSPIADSRHAVLVGQRVKELVRRYSRLDGLVLLIDACHSGLAAEAAGREWLTPIRRTRRRFELLTATDESFAYGACLSRSLTRIIRTGRPELGERLYCTDLKLQVDDLCRYQVAVHMTYDGSHEVLGGDAGLWLAVNATAAWRSSPLADTGAMAQIQRLTEFYEPTPAFDALRDLVSSGTRSVVVTGGAGSGKSASVAALAHPHHGTGVDAAVFLSGTATVEQVAAELARQLRTRDIGFPEASSAYWSEELPGRWPHVDAVEVHVLGPLRRISRRVRIVVDGVDAHDPLVGRALMTSLGRVDTEPDLSHVQLVVTGSLAREHLPSALEIAVAGPGEAELTRYAELRGLGTHHIPHVVALSRGSWLSARLITDGLLATTSTLSAAGPPPSDHDQAYADFLRRAGLLRGDADAGRLRAVLTVLLACDVGPVLPIGVLLAAAHHLGGPDAIGSLRDILLRLAAVVVRGRPGTADEHVGFGERAFADFLRRQPDFAERSGHEALVAARSTMPAEYAVAALHRHLWRAGLRTEALEFLADHESHVPAENRTRWAAVAASTGDDELALTAQARLATWTAKSGEPETAVAAFRELIHQATALLGPQHVETSSLRNNLAFWTGESGDWPAAQRMYVQLTRDCTATLGPEHPETLSAEHHLALSFAKQQNLAEAMPRFRRVRDLRERVMGPDHIDTLRSRHNILYWEAENDHPPPLRKRGPDSSTTSFTRSGPTTRKPSPPASTKHCSAPSAGRSPRRSPRSGRSSRTRNGCSAHGTRTRTRSTCNSLSGCGGSMSSRDDR